MSIENDILARLSKWYAEPNDPEAWEIDLMSEAVDAIMPLVKRAQAEALREHGRVIAYWERGNSSRVLRYSVDRLVADLNERADKIEKEAGQ